MIRPFSGCVPVITQPCFIAETAVVVGDVEVGAHSSLWYGAVLRGDVNIIRIGRRVNIQDGTVVHVAGRGQGTFVGDRVTVGHMALLHACTIQDDAFIGMQACIMDGAVIGAGAMVAAGALVTPGKQVSAGELWAGRPARFVRELTAAERAANAASADHYWALAEMYREEP